MFSKRAEQARKAEINALKVRAAAAMVAGKGMHNVNLWAFVLGTLGAIFATLFIIDWLTRDQTPPPARVPPPSEPSGEIQVELE
jgi:hypothetical protein